MSAFGIIYELFNFFYSFILFCRVIVFFVKNNRFFVIGW